MRAVGLRLRLLLVLAWPAAAGAGAVTLTGMSEFPALFGTYAPGGQCARHPQFTVDRAGMRFELPGGPRLADRPEYGASYFGDGYSGIAVWFAPWFQGRGQDPISVVFNADEKPGEVTIQAHDYDYRGGPRLPAQYRALVDGSPYRRCR